METLPNKMADPLLKITQLRSLDRELVLTPKRVRNLLLYAVAVLIVGYIISGFINKTLHVENAFSDAFYYLFDLDGEDNISSTFSFFILIVASALLGITGFVTNIRKDRKFWFFLSFIFLFLALDELIQIHENISAYLKSNGTTVIASSDYVWVIPYAIFAMVVGLLMIRFVLRLPRSTRNLFFISAGLFIGSALVIDYVQGIIEKKHLNHLYYKVLTIIEEPGEMIGITIFIYALLGYLTTSGRIVSLSFNQDEKAKN